MAVVEEEQSCYSASSYFQHLSRGIPEEFCFLCLLISHPQAHSTKANPSLVKMQLLASYRGKKQKDAQKGKSPSLAPYLQVQRPGGKKSMLPTDHHPPHPNIKAPLKEQAHLTHVYFLCLLQPQCEWVSVPQFRLPPRYTYPQR